MVPQYVNGRTQRNCMMTSSHRYKPRRSTVNAGPTANALKYHHAGDSVMTVNNATAVRAAAAAYWTLRRCDTSHDSATPSAKSSHVPSKKYPVVGAPNRSSIVAITPNVTTAIEGRNHL